MDWVQGFLIIFGIVFITTLITLGIIILLKLGKKKVVYATLFLKSGSQSKFTINRIKSKSTTIDECTYTFDEKAIRKTPWKDFIYYKEGIPSPLLFDEVGVKSNMTPEQLKLIMSDGLAKELLGDDDIKTLKLLVIICLISGVITMLLSIYLIAGGVNLKDSEQNRLFLTNITRSVILGV